MCFVLRDEVDELDNRHSGFWLSLARWLWTVKTPQNAYHGCEKHKQWQCVNVIDITWGYIYFSTCENFGQKFICVQYPLLLSARHIGIIFHIRPMMIFTFKAIIGRFQYRSNNIVHPKRMVGWMLTYIIFFQHSASNMTFVPNNLVFNLFSYVIIDICLNSLASTMAVWMHLCLCSIKRY